MTGRITLPYGYIPFDRYIVLEDDALVLFYRDGDNNPFMIYASDLIVFTEGEIFHYKEFKCESDGKIVDLDLL